MGDSGSQAEAKDGKYGIGKSAVRRMRGLVAASVRHEAADKSNQNP